MAIEIKHFSQNEVAKQCAKRLLELCQKPTLLLVSGGSSFSVLKELKGLKQVTFGFVDERFEQKNSNFALMLEKVPELKDKPWIDTRPHKKDQYAMAEWYELKLSTISRQQTIILLGMGVDGHIAGILPDKKENFVNTYVNTDRSVVGFDATGRNEFPKRFTLTYSALEKADHILAYITGEEKKKMLSHALHDNPPFNECPAAFFSCTRQPCEIFTNISTTRVRSD